MLGDKNYSCAAEVTTWSLLCVYYLSVFMLFCCFWLILQPYYSQALSTSDKWLLWKHLVFSCSCFSGSFASCSFLPFNLFQACFLFYLFINKMNQGRGNHDNMEKFSFIWLNLFSVTSLIVIMMISIYADILFTLCISRLLIF